MSVERSIKSGIGRGKREIFDSFPEKKDYYKCFVNKEYKLSGRGVKIAVLDTGFPCHKDIIVKTKSVSFCDNSQYDKIGHSTMISGIICAKGEFNGISQNAEVYYGKIMKDNKRALFSSLVAGVIWAITKDVDIIVLAIGTDYDYNVFHDAIQKASERGICIFSPSGRNIIKEQDEILYPSRYNEVFSTSFLSRSEKQNKIIKNKVDFYIPNFKIYTTYNDDKYIKINGSSFSTAILAGISSNLIELYKKEKVNKKEIPKIIKKDMLNKLNKIKKGV